MKAMIVGILCCLLSFSCTNRKKSVLPEKTSDSAFVVIGGVEEDTVAITLGEHADSTRIAADKDTVIYEMPSYYLWYRKDLPKSDRKQAYEFRTERQVYWPDVKVINVFLANYTDEPLAFSTEWELQQWNGEDWQHPQMKHLPRVGEAEWMTDERGHRLYCFRIPIGDFCHLPKGRYRLNKTIMPHDQHVICLSAPFEIP